MAKLHSFKLEAPDSHCNTHKTKHEFELWSIGRNLSAYSHHLILQGEHGLYSHEIVIDTDLDSFDIAKSILSVWRQYEGHIEINLQKHIKKRMMV